MVAKNVIANNLRTLRKVRGLTQPELAGIVNMSPRTVARLEAGQVSDPGINQVRSLAQALGVTVDLLSGAKLTPVTVAAPERLKKVLEGPQGLELLTELADYDRVRGRKAVVSALKEAAGNLE
ncbi:MAG: helix-turn-helix transcriptional regulator [Myxococcales bacterium]|nr:MAG: helix-turn-helix transcriptional regulator [Myxococcales bacterium]